MNSKSKLIVETFKQIYGIKAPQMFWANHDDMLIWYDEVTNKICTECGYSKDMNIPYSEINRYTLSLFLDELEEDIIKYYQINNIITLIPM